MDASGLVGPAHVVGRVLAMIAPDLLDLHFGSHPDETGPGYAGIRAAERVALAVILAAMRTGAPVAECWASVDAAARAYAEAIDVCAPDGCDKSFAIRSVRLMRAAANEAIEFQGTVDFEGIEELLRIAVAEGRKARWQACAAVAGGGR